MRLDELIEGPTELIETVNVNQDNLTEMFEQIPGWIAYWGEQHADALAAYLEAKAERERVYGVLMSDPDITSDLEAEIGKKPNLDQVKGAVLDDERYMEAKANEIATDAERARLRSRCDAALAAKETAISLGAHRRAEMQQQIHIREE